MRPLSERPTKSPIRALLQTRLQRLLRERGVIVWYDDAGAFRRVLDDLDLGDATRRYVYTGSYYALRAAVEPAFAALPGPAQSPLLVYVPTSPLDRREDVLREVAAAGAVFDEPLASLARPALREAGVPATTIEEWLARPNLTLEDLEQLATAGTERDAAIALLFGTTDPIEVGVKLLTDDTMPMRISERTALADVRRFLRERFGFAAGASDVITCRATFLRYVLLSEFVAALRGDPPPELERVPRATEVEAAGRCQAVAARLRDSERFADFYVQAATGVERQLSLGQLGLAADTLGDAETFPFQEQLLLDALAGMVEADDLAAAQQSVAQHRRSFWARASPRRQVQWQVSALVLDLIAAAGQVKREISSAALNPATLVQRYAGSEKSPGWQRLDRLQRELESLVAGMEEDVNLPNLLRRARLTYHEAAAALADRFLEAIRQHDFQFPGLAAQTDTFTRYVAPRLALGKVAYVLVDALRYEMAAALVEMPPAAVQSCTLTPAIAVVPSITVLGMAALLPGAEGGIGIVVKGPKAVAAQLGAEVLAGNADRLRYLRARLAEPVLDITLGDLIAGRIGAEALAAAQLCLVRSQELDQTGENVASSMAAAAISPLLPQLKRALSRLAQHGFGEVVIAADHGFLLLHDLPDAQKVDPPLGEEVVSHRRCWIGRGASTADAFVRFRAADLGMGGDLELAFPRGIAAFRATGGEYMHGGLSPQELIIPVVTLSLQTAADRTRRRVDLLPIGRVTNQMFYVRLRWETGMFETAERLRVHIAVSPEKLKGRILLASEGHVPGTDEVALSPGVDTTVTLQLQAPTGSGTLDVKVLDADTGRTLASQKDVEYTITHSLLF